MPFDLPYLVDNGTLHDWPADYLPNVRLVQWTDEKDFSVLDATGKPVGWGETAEDAVADARCRATDARRKADGIHPARVC